MEVKPMKKPIFTTIALILSVIALAKLFKANQPKTVTEICILADYFDHINSTAILEESLKAITTECNHIFLNKSLWKTSIADLDKDAFNSMWDVYDTHIGLMYIHNKKASFLPGMDMNKCSLIQDPFNIETIESINEDRKWGSDFESLIDIKSWQQYHSNPNNKICVYMNGHGMMRATTGHDSELVCSINAKQFAHLLDFFDSKLRIDLLGIQSCYWTAQRVHELMNDIYGHKTLHFTILSPLNSEEVLWLDTAYNYMNSDNEKTSFFECCADFTEQYNNKITDEIKELVYKTDTFALQQNNKQRATMIAGGTSELITIARA